MLLFGGICCFSAFCSVLFSWLCRHKLYVMRFYCNQNVCVCLCLFGQSHFRLPHGHMCHLLRAKHTKHTFLYNAMFLSAFLREFVHTFGFTLLLSLIFSFFLSLFLPFSFSFSSGFVILIWDYEFRNTIALFIHTFVSMVDFFCLVR